MKLLAAYRSLHKLGFLSNFLFPFCPVYDTMTTGSILSRSVFTGSVQLAGSSSFFVLLYAAICEQVLIDVFYRKRISIRNDM